MKNIRLLVYSPEGIKNKLERLSSLTNPPHVMSALHRLQRATDSQLMLVNDNPATSGKKSTAANRIDAIQTAAACTATANGSEAIRTAAACTATANGSEANSNRSYELNINNTDTNEGMMDSNSIDDAERAQLESILRDNYSQPSVYHAHCNMKVYNG